MLKWNKAAVSPGKDKANEKNWTWSNMSLKIANRVMGWAFDSVEKMLLVWLHPISNYLSPGSSSIQHPGVYSENWGWCLMSLCICQLYGRSELNSELLDLTRQSKWAKKGAVLFHFCVSGSLCLLIKRK